MVLVDSNVLLDVLGRDPVWMTWSAREMRRHARNDSLAINQIIYAEVAAGYLTAQLLDQALGHLLLTRLFLPYEAAFAAGQAFAAYRRAGGDKRSPMPDFYIGAHAAIAALPLLTRDVRTYRTYFPDVQLITPPSA